MRKAIVPFLYEKHKQKQNNSFAIRYLNSIKHFVFWTFPIKTQIFNHIQSCICRCLQSTAFCAILPRKRNKTATRWDLVLGVTECFSNTNYCSKSDRSQIRKKVWSVTDDKKNMIGHRLKKRSNQANLMSQVTADSVYDKLRMFNGQAASWAW